MKPLLRLGPFSNRVYLITRYRERDDGLIDAQTKYDVTDEVGNLLEELDAKGLELRPRPAPDDEEQPAKPA